MRRRNIIDIVIASLNDDKVKEINTFFKNSNYNFISLKQITKENKHIDIIKLTESYDTFEKNALEKAKFVYQLLLNNYNVLADDSGLVIPALNGLPGVNSSLFGVENFENIKDLTPEDIYSFNRLKVIEKMKGITNRYAYFLCVLVLILKDGSILKAIGQCEGEIIEEKDFDINIKGFGYDPIFFSYDKKALFNKLSIEEKNEISHRGRALKLLANKLKIITK